ncbi:hypothetical protein [Mycobacterium sp.]|uniref:hypothetical protein n=1 Tax=Mycobacterium sp. TaxID=1785 RepID=UPI003F9BC29B
MGAQVAADERGAAAAVPARAVYRRLVALVRTGAVFHKGKLLERPFDITPDTSNAEPQNAGSEVA